MATRHLKAHFMLTTGHQLRAARSLLGWKQEDLSVKAGVGVNTVRRMEGFGPKEINAYGATIRAVQRALEKAGIEFIAENGGGPGVRLKKPRRAKR